MDRRAAIGIARGWLPKPYAYVDPNEDAVACVAGPRATLLVVADGHQGRIASHTAVQVAVDLLGRDPRPADLQEHEIVEAASRIEQRIGMTQSPEQRPSRTTLIVGLHAAGRLQWFAAGDSALFVGNATRLQVLPSATSWFFGDRLPPRVMQSALSTGTVAVEPDDWVVAATDGYTDYLPAGMTAVAAVRHALDRPAGHVDATGEHAEAGGWNAGSVTAPADVVSVMLDQARLGGAGDNVAALACRPWYKPRDGDDDDRHHDG